MDDLIDRMAKLIIEQNSMAIGEDVAKNAIDKINNEKQSRKNKKEEGGTEEEKKKKTKRRRTTKTAE